MTADKHAKREAHALAEQLGISYTAARRRLAATQDTPPELRPRAATICPEPCDGSAHPRAVCWVWTPFADVEGGRDRLRIPWDIRQAATLPMDRGEYLRKRRPENNAAIVTYRPPFLLALVYDLLAVEQPHLVPARAQLRAAVEGHDLAAVDALMEPVDRAAATLIPYDAHTWWHTLKPRLDAHVQRRTGWWPSPSDAYHHVRSLDRALDLWVKAFTPARNYNGYMESEGVIWMEPKRDLDALLVHRCGGRAPGQQARLDDGRDVTVLAARWEQTGPPAGYQVRLVHRPGTPLVLDAESVTPDQFTDIEPAAQLVTAPAREEWRERQLLRQASEPDSRGWYLIDRFRQHIAGGGEHVFLDYPSATDRAVFLHLVYSAVLHGRPGLAPDPATVAAAVAAGNMDAVNAAMMPLDRAARLFLDQPSPAWRIALAEHAQAQAHPAGPGSSTSARGRVDAYQRRATRVETGSDGYPTSRGYPYVGARQTLDAVLAAQTGGHPPGQIVHLPNGQACVVKAAQWWDDNDGPAGYVLLPLLPPGELRTELEVRADTVTADG